MKRILLWALVASQACTCDSLVEKHRFACATDEDCAPGVRCASGLCGDEPGEDQDGGTGASTDAGSGGGVDAGPDGGPPATPAKLALALPAVVLASSCAAGEVRSQDLSGQPAAASSALSVGLSAPPGTDFGFFADAACLTGITAAGLVAGSSAGGFFFRGRKGGVVNVTAEAPPLQGAALDVEVVGTVRGGVCSLAAGASSTSCVVSPPLFDRAKAFMLFQATSPETAPGGSSTSCSLEAASRLLCERAAGGAPVAIRWQVAELPSGVHVQHLQPSCDGGVTVVEVPAQVNPASAFLLYSSSQAGSTWDLNDFRHLALEDAGAGVRIGMKDSTCPASLKQSLQVVELAGAWVSRRTEGWSTGTMAELVQSLPAVDSTATALFYSYDTWANPGTARCLMVRGDVTSPSSLSFTRGDGSGAPCTDEDVESVSWERVQFPPPTKVVSVSVAMAAGVFAVDAGLAAVDPTRTLVFAGGQWSNGQATGEGAADGGSDFSDVLAQFYLASPTELVATRASARESARWTAYVVELSP